MTQGIELLPMNVFEERAEHLSKTDLINWSILSDKELAVVKKLKGMGLKLLSGPRGSGKSTLLLRAYYEVLDDEDALCAYINFSRSIILEPLFREKSNAIPIFRQWVLGLIIIGLDRFLREKSIVPPEKISKEIFYYKAFIDEIEKGVYRDDFSDAMSVRNLVEIISETCISLNKNRCILLLDDAAHAFSVEQQREFFEIFASLKSPKLAAKAAVYPGVTSYSPTFHVGHDAELVNIWYNPEDPEYLRLMQQIVRVRMPDIYQNQFIGRINIINLLAHASFGVPRSLSRGQK